MPRLTQKASRQLEEKGEQQKDQRESSGSVSKEQGQPVIEHPCLVLPERERDPCGQRRLRSLHVLVDSVGDIESALVSGSEHGEEDGRFLVEACVLVGFGESIDNGGHLAKQ